MSGTRLERVRAAASIASLALQQIEDNLSADDIDQEELAAILRELLEDTDPSGGFLAAVAQLLTAAARRAVDGEGDVGFDVLVPCPHDGECDGYAWVPAYSVTCLFRALNGDLDDDEDIVCTVHGPNNGDDHDDDPDGRADLEEQVLEAIRG
ncbi:hypothetical protein [Streptomyces pseudogriseolus]|uniref:hypothetical protein n=1 Tax=Streptomyces pseudogriseolus TaxID=36817 RepID=UPI003FA31E8D